MSKKILVVDDEKLVVDFLKLRLNANDYSVMTASNGKEGLERARKDQPDLIILDIAMPEMDGIEAVTQLKNDPQLRKIPVIFLTALKRKDEETVFGDKIANHVIIAKPFDEDQLLTRVREFIGA